MYSSTLNGDEPDVCYAMNQQHDDHSSCGFLDHVYSGQGDDYLKLQLGNHEDLRNTDDDSDANDQHLDCKAPIHVGGHYGGDDSRHCSCYDGANKVNCVDDRYCPSGVFVQTLQQIVSAKPLAQG